MHYNRIDLSKGIIYGVCKFCAWWLWVYIVNMYMIEINIKNRLYNYYFDHLIKTKNLETKNNLINEKNYKDLVIYFSRYEVENQ